MQGPEFLVDSYGCLLISAGGCIVRLLRRSARKRVLLWVGFITPISYYRDESFSQKIKIGFFGVFWKKRLGDMPF